MKYVFATLAALAAALTTQSAPAEMNDDVRALQNRWAVVRYDTAEKDRTDAYKALADEADRVIEAQPDNTEAHVWAGIIHSTWAGEAGGFGAMKHARHARKELEQALAMNPDALHGAVYTSLGSLLYQIPGIMGGDDEQAEVYLLKGIQLDPDGIDSNYFYAAFLADHERYAEARPFVERALAAPPRAGRELADRGRRAELADLQARVQAQLN